MLRFILKKHHKHADMPGQEFEDRFGKHARFEKASWLYWQWLKLVGEDWPADTRIIEHNGILWWR